jgi:hypothetical protein
MRSSTLTVGRYLEFLGASEKLVEWPPDVWQIVLAARVLNIADIHVNGELCNALLQLCAVADEACVSWFERGPGFRGVCDTVLTQFRKAVSSTIIATYGDVQT